MQEETYSIAMGIYTTASGQYSTAMGIITTASGQYSTAMGGWNIASGEISTAMGYQTTASAYYSTAMGDSTVASGEISTAMGYRTEALVYSSTAMGDLTVASGVVSTAMGGWTIASGDYSTTMGVSTLAPSFCETAIGRFNTTYTPGSSTGWNPSDRLFVIGNGTTGYTQSNAVTVLKNGCVGLQEVTTPTYALQLPNSSTIAVGSGKAYAWTTYSDSRLKEDQVPITYGLKELMELSPMQYIHHSSIDQSTWAKENIPRTIGLIAQEVYKVIPEAVDVPENSATGLWGLNYDKLIPVLVKGIQEAAATNLKSTITNRICKTGKSAA